MVMTAYDTWKTTAPEDADPELHPPPRTCPWCGDGFDGHAETVHVDDETEYHADCYSEWLAEVAEEKRRVK